MNNIFVLKPLLFLSIFFSLHSITISQSAHNMYQTGVSKMQTGDYTAAMKYFDQIIELRPYYYEAWMERSLCKYETGDKKGAFEDIEKARELNPDFYLTYHYRALLNNKEGATRPALDDLGKCLSMNPKHAESHFVRAEIYFTDIQYDKALADINKAIKLKAGKATAEYFLLRSSIYEKKGEIGNAIEDLGNAISKSNPDAGQFYHRATLYIKNNSKDLALQDLKKASGLGMESPELTAQMADIYFREGMYIEAVTEYTKLISEWRISDNAGYYLNRGISYYNIDKTDKAIRDYGKAMMFDRENDDIVLMRAEAYLKQGKDINAATDYRRILRKNEKNADAWMGLGKLSISKEKYERGYDEFSRAIKNKPTAEAYYQRAICLDEMSDVKAACEDLQEAAKLGHAEAIEKIESYCR